jgi:hypothetical protein
MYKKDICEKEKQERDCLVMDLVIGGRPDRVRELLAHLDFDMHPPGPELKRLAEELEKKLEAQ